MGGAWQGMRLRVGGVLEGAGCLVGGTAIWAGGALSGWGREGAGWELEAHAGPLGGHGLGGHGLGGPDVTPLSQSWAGPHRHWQVSSRHHQTRTLDYGYLLGLLEDMQAHWEESASLPQEQVGSAALLKMPFLEGVPWACSGWADSEGPSSALAGARPGKLIWS